MTELMATSQPRPPADRADHPPEPRPTILVVDDTPDTRRLMRRVLERSGLHVLEAATGTDGLVSIRSHRPDAVVLDLRMPGLTGFEVARAVRADPDPAIATTPLLACSASVQAEVRREALDAGCDAFEGKPIDIHTFAELLLGLIARRRVR
jgi:CheY-like chemotaxis protein